MPSDWLHPTSSTEADQGVTATKVARGPSLRPRHFIRVVVGMHGRVQPIVSARLMPRSVILGCI